MDFEKLKQSVEKIELPEEMRARIVQNCKTKLFLETEETTMKQIWSKKRILAASAIGLILCLTVGVSAAETAGFFRDVHNWTGAVVGTQYEQATEEITASAVASKTELTVIVTFVQPDIFPYRSFEEFGIDRYQIADASGDIVAEGTRTELSELSDGKAEVKIPLNQLSGGTYRLTITSFVGASKADQPLPISGTWLCDFTVE